MFCHIWFSFVSLYIFYLPSLFFCVVYPDALMSFLVKQYFFLFNHIISFKFERNLRHSWLVNTDVSPWITLLNESCHHFYSLNWQFFYWSHVSFQLVIANLLLTSAKNFYLTVDRFWCRRFCWYIFRVANYKIIQWFFYSFKLFHNNIFAFIKNTININNIVM